MKGAKPEGGLRAFIFDLGKVLVDFDFEIAIRALERRFSVDRLKLLALFGSSDVVRRWDCGTAGPGEFFAAVQETMRFPLSMEEFAQAWNSIFTEKTEVIELVTALQRRFPVVILSNTNPWHAEQLRKSCAWLGRLQGFVASCDVKVMKPDPEIFRLALRRAGSLPEETFYTDDIPENVEAARALGLDAVLFRNPGQLRRDLIRRGLEPLLPPAST